MPEIKLTYNGEVSESGLFKIFNKNLLLKEVEMFAGKKVKITIERKRKSRSIFQNAYYFGVVVPMVQYGLIDVGYKVDKNSTHDLLKAKFHKIELVNETTGEVLDSIGSTAKMSTVQMMEYFEEIKQWAAEYLNIYIPEPGEQSSLNLESFLT